MRGFRLGSVLGFEIRIDHSWFLIFFLILWTLSAGVFPASHPGLDSGVYLAMGFIGTLLFFASLLAHELAHSVVARRRGIVVEGITLFVFGGMAHTRTEAETPADEFVIAGVGPLSSLVIAAAFALSASIGAWLGWSPAINGVAAYLAFINVALAVFNLLPGFPLDGGRLFRAAVWRATGDLRKATRWATTGGRWLGYGLMAFGAFAVFFTGVLSGLWLLFIGWFVRTAAEASFAQHVLRESLAGVRAGTLMTPEPVSVPPDCAIQRFVEDYVMHGKHRAWPVTSDGRAVGLITLENVRAVPREQWSIRTVQDVMLPANGVLTVGEGDDMTAVIEKLGKAASGRVLVADDGRLVGIITGTDLARWLDRATLLTT
jgi:Zn-dependent protease